MEENTIIFKGYLRSIMRQLQLLEKAIDTNNIEDAKTLINELIKDTQNNIEDDN
ncbi:MAG: hypothetical protein IJC04_07680 [Oscillospiraceae bacterium]|nr:hypothetical protein [Oscillospiraceae bacterium]